MSDESVVFTKLGQTLPGRQRGLSLVSLVFIGLIAIMLLTD